MNTLWGTIIGRTLLIAVVATGALLWPAAALAEAPPGSYTWNGHSFNTEDARLKYTNSIGTYYKFDNGLNANWSTYYGKFLSGSKSDPWWVFQGRVTRMDIGNGCAYVQHRRGEFEVNTGYRVTCSYGARTADYVIDNRKAPAGQRCLKRGDVFYCSRFKYGRQTAKFTYRTQGEQNVREARDEGVVMECGAVATSGSGLHGFPARFVVFSRDAASCDAAFADRTQLENMVDWSSIHAGPADPHRTIGGGMDCFRIFNAEKISCTNGSQCVVLMPFTMGRYARVDDGWRAWSNFAASPYAPFSNC